MEEASGRSPPPRGFPVIGVVVGILLGHHLPLRLRVREVLMRVETLGFFSRAATYVHLNYKLERLLDDMSAIYDES